MMVRCRSLGYPEKSPLYPCGLGVKLNCLQITDSGSYPHPPPFGKARHVSCPFSADMMTAWHCADLAVGCPHQWASSRQRAAFSNSDSQPSEETCVIEQTLTNFMCSLQQWKLFHAGISARSAASAFEAASFKATAAGPPPQLAQSSGDNLDVCGCDDSGFRS